MLFQEGAGKAKRTLPPAALPALAPALFVVVALLFAPLARLLRYAAFGAPELDAPLPLLVPAALLGALLHERLVRGALYARLRAALPAGLGAPAVALVGVAAPFAARLALFPVPRVSPAAVGVHAFLVEYALSLGLTWLALGTARTLPGGAALGSIWLFRLLVSVRFHGGFVPLLELFSAIAAAAAVVAVLREPLAPHHGALTEAP